MVKGQMYIRAAAQDHCISTVMGTQELNKRASLKTFMKSLVK